MWQAAPDRPARRHGVRVGTAGRGHRHGELAKTVGGLAVT
ncbi:hypothetical protein BN2537_703 [Streptomyces venezuelae]|nr:hypothetical protein BN2537_703 [Streptomyces venezuelae]